TSERRWVASLPRAPAVVAGERTVPSSPRMGRRIVADAWRLRAPDGAVLCRRSRPLDLRRDLPLLDARDRARVSRSAGRNRARRLLSDVSHELRTPLSVVQGNLEALVDGVHPPDEEHLLAILDETKVLSRLVEDLRTLSLAESGALTLHREPTDLAALAKETI